MRKFISLAFCSVLLVCNWPQTAASAPHKLNSGKSVEILGIGPVYFTKGDPALVLKYRTNVPLKDVATLRKEADEIWNKFVVNVERKKYKNAAITASGPKSGFIITTNKTHSFVYQKRNGIWHTLESKAVTKNKLTAAFVKEYVERIDNILRNGSVNALLLYLDKDWTNKISNPLKVGPPSETIARMQFAANFHRQIMSGATIVLNRKILGVRISKSKLRATVESRVTEKLTIKGVEISSIGRSIDVLELRDGFLVTVKSEGVLGKFTKTKAN